jgi:hypothetical protein
MGGGGGGKSKKSSAPPQAQPLDVGSIMAASSAAATQQIKEQYKSLIENYPALEALSLGTADTIAGRLGDKPNPVYEVRVKPDGTYERVQVGMSAPNQQTIDALARIRQGLALGDMEPDASMPTSIEQSLYDQGERDLALGRSLSAEQERAAQQSARAAFSARGLGTSLGSSAAEILNRDAAASARERERQGFAAAANDQYIGNVATRRQALGNLYFAGAQNLLAADPYERAIDRGLNYSGGSQGRQMAMAGQTFGSANQLAGQVASFNANMLDSRYNSWANNNAAMRAAGMQSSAMNNAARMGMIGSAIQGGIQAGGLVGAAQMAPMMFSDKRMKKDIKPLGKAGSVLGLTTYEYSYKGDDKKRVGFMAQDVQKVLPEAVAEVDYKGKKRLAIKPAVIGAALAEELMAAKAA